MNEKSSTHGGDSSGVKWVCQLIAAEAVLGILGNILVCFVILRVKFLHNMTNYLLVNLAVADMLSCLQAFFFHLGADRNCTLVRFSPSSWAGKEFLCRFLASGFLYWIFSYASAYSLCLVTLERYVAIVNPLQYTRRLTASRMKMLTAAIWVISMLFSLPVLFTNEPSDDPNMTCLASHHFSTLHVRLVTMHVFSFLLCYVLPIASMSWAYYKIQVTLQRQVRALKLQQARAAAYDLLTARQRVVSMLTMVLGALVILWTPAHVESMICMHPSQTDSTFHVCTSESYRSIRGVCNFLFFLNSVINPIIYEFKYKKFQRGLKVAFCACPQDRPGDNRVAVVISQEVESRML